MPGGVIGLRSCGLRGREWASRDRDCHFAKPCREAFSRPLCAGYPKGTGNRFAMNSDPMVRRLRETDSRPWGQVSLVQTATNTKLTPHDPLGPTTPELFSRAPGSAPRAPWCTRFFIRSVARLSESRSAARLGESSNGAIFLRAQARNKHGGSGGISATLGRNQKINRRERR